MDRRHPFVPSEDLDLRLEMSDGTIIDWEAYSRLESLKRQFELSRFIHLTALSTTVYFQSDEFENKISVHLEKDSAEIFTIANARDKTEIPKSGLIVYLLQGIQVRMLGCTTEPVLLVIGEINGVYERLGLNRELFPGYWDVEQSVRQFRIG
jgi:hypothetical protein